MGPSGGEKGGSFFTPTPTQASCRVPAPPPWRQRLHRSNPTPWPAPPSLPGLPVANGRGQSLRWEPGALAAPPPRPGWNWGPGGKGLPACDPARGLQLLFPGALSDPPHAVLFCLQPSADTPAVCLLSPPLTPGRQKC